MERQPRVCVVTGGTRGIGLATARRFAGEGFHVAVCGRDRERLDAARVEIGRQANAENNVLAFQVDLAEPRGAEHFVNEALSHFGGIDILVNNAAMAPLSALHEMDDASFDAVTQLNIAGVFHVTRAAWRAMQSQQGGIVVNISSQAAVDPFPGFSVYGASKAWLEGFTVALAGEGRDHNIRTYGIRAGAVETPMLRGLFADFPTENAVAPQEVAECIWLVCQPGFAHSSGQIVSVSRQ